MKNIPTIHDLRKQGYKVRVSHFRNVIKGGQPLFTRVTKIDKKVGIFEDILPHGGETHFQLTTPGDAVDYVATARCSDKDTFNRELGNRICILRLISMGAIPVNV